jgi:hypothetical protein
VENAEVVAENVEAAENVEVAENVVAAGNAKVAEKDVENQQINKKNKQCYNLKKPSSENSSKA